MQSTSLRMVSTSRIDWGRTAYLLLIGAFLVAFWAGVFYLLGIDPVTIIKDVAQGLIQFYQYLRHFGQ